MAILKIPQSEYVVLGKLADLSPSDFDAILQGIQESGTGIIQSDFAEKLAAKIPSSKASDLDAMLRTVTSLYTATQRWNKTAADLASDLKDTVEMHKPKALPVDKLPSLSDRLQKFFELGKIIGLRSKVMEVMTGEDHIFCGVKLISDIRPVFHDSTDSVSAAMVIHHLRIGYHKDGEHTEFSVAMNTDDVKAVVEAMERAEKKAKTLKNFIQKSGIPYFEDHE